MILTIVTEKKKVKWFVQVLKMSSCCIFQRKERIIKNLEKNKEKYVVFEKKREKELDREK